MGFTLIELLVVVLIIGILAAVALPQYQVAVAKSRLSQAFVLAKSIKDAEEAYYLANGTYTEDLDALGIDFGSYNTPNKTVGISSTNTFANGYTSTVSINGDGSIEDSVGSWVPSYYYSDKQGIVFFLDHPKVTSSKHFKGVWCYAKKDVYQKACKAMGGVLKDSVSNTGINAYELPL